MAHHGASARMSGTRAATTAPRTGSQSSATTPPNVHGQRLGAVGASRRWICDRCRNRDPGRLQALPTHPPQANRLATALTARGGGLRILPHSQGVGVSRSPVTDSTMRGFKNHTQDSSYGSVSLPPLRGRARERQKGDRGFGLRSKTPRARLDTSVGVRAASPIPSPDALKIPRTKDSQVRRTGSTESAETR